MESKVVLVTGSSREIGKAIVMDLARKGYNVVINYIKENNQAKELKERLEKEYHIKALTIRADVTNESEVQKMIDTIINKFGRTDVLVNKLVLLLIKSLKKSIDEIKTYTRNSIGFFIKFLNLERGLILGILIYLDILFLYRKENLPVSKFVINF